MTVAAALRVEGFRNQANESIQLGRLTLITGPNGSGKSSIQDALAYLATGTCRGLTKSGAGIEGLRRNGTDDLQVSIYAEGSTDRPAALRSFRPGKRGGTPKRKELGVTDWLDNRNADALAIAVRPDVFSSLHEREQASSLLGFAGLGPITGWTLLDAGLPKELLPHCPDFTEDEDGTYTPSHEPAYLDGTMGGIQRLIAAVAAQRACAGTAVSSAQSEVDTLGGGLYSEQAHATAETAVTEAMAAKDEARRARDHATGEWEQREASTTEAIGDHRARAEELEAQVAEAPEDLTSKMETLTAKMDELAAERRKLDERIADAREERSQLGDQADAARKAAEEGIAQQAKDERHKVECKSDELLIIRADRAAALHPLHEDVDATDTTHRTACESLSQQENAKVGAARAATASTALTAATDTYEALDLLVRTLDGREGTVRAEVMDAPLSLVQTKLTEAIALVSDVVGEEEPAYGCEVSLSDTGGLVLSIIKRTPEGDPYPVEYAAASGGEQQRITWALQAMAGLECGLCVLDAGESIDDPDAGIRLGEWLAAQDVQVILCSLPREVPDGWTHHDLAPRAERSEPNE